VPCDDREQLGQEREWMDCLENRSRLMTLMQWTIGMTLWQVIMWLLDDLWQQMYRLTILLRHLAGHHRQVRVTVSLLHMWPVSANDTGLTYVTYSVEFLVSDAVSW